MALIAIEVKTGELKVLVGGKDFLSSPYNRAVQAKRQPGSSFKPIIYLAALEKGMKADTMLLDAPVSFTNPYTHQVWSPHNYKNEYYGSVTMRRALEASLNTATVRLLERTGIDNVIDLAKRLHIEANFQPNLSLALGTTEIAPLDLANAYAVFARGGIYMPPLAVKKVATTEGEEKYTEETHGETVISPEVAMALVDIMKGVVKRGTARAAAGMPYTLAGKTGQPTSSEMPGSSAFHPTCCAPYGSVSTRRHTWETRNPAVPPPFPSGSISCQRPFPGTRMRISHFKLSRPKGDQTERRPDHIRGSVRSRGLRVSMAFVLYMHTHLLTNAVH